MTDERAEQILPAWFIPRMMGDCWSFGLLMTSGLVIHIEHIDAIHHAADGSIWIDVTLSRSCGPYAQQGGHFVAPSSRLQASINVTHIMAAFETADT